MNEIENILKGKDDKKKPGRKKGTHNYQDFDLSKISTRDEYIDSFIQKAYDIFKSLYICFSTV